MNKLDVALKLLRLLNERKSIDSTLVADELNVSLRTAQRYLLDLSSLPCVVSDDRNHTYALSTEYRLNPALLGEERPQLFAGEVEQYVKEALRLKEILCLTCGNNRKYLLDIPALAGGKNRPRDNRQAINQWVHLFRKKLGGPGYRLP